MSEATDTCTDLPQGQNGQQTCFKKELPKATRADPALIIHRKRHAEKFTNHFQATPKHQVEESPVSFDYLPILILGITVIISYLCSDFLRLPGMNDLTSISSALALFAWIGDVKKRSPSRRDDFLFLSLSLF